MKEFSQLWKEEKDLLFEYAAIIPEGGIIVEIGTAQGGSASIFYEATKNKRVKIYSYDIAPSEEAYLNLKNTSVEIINKPSTEGALNWIKEKKKSIDLLFIDGSHAFEDVYQDFNFWAPLLKSSGTVVFHDYDPTERGGLAHLGVRIVVDTIIKCGLLESYSHKYRLLSGIVKEPVKELRITDCATTLRDILNRVKRVGENDLSKWRISGDKVWSRMLQCCLKLDVDDTVPLFSNTVNEPRKNGLAYICDISVSENTGATDGTVIPITQLDACYILYAGLTNNRDCLLELTKDRRIFFEWEEILQMYTHAFDEMPLNNTNSLLNLNLSDLSKLIAKEQVRLKILSNILRTIIE